MKNAGEGGGHFMYRMLMKLSQSIEDGTMGIYRGACDPAVESGTLLGPNGITGEAVVNDLTKDHKKLPAEALDAFWEASCAATGVENFFNSSS